MFTYSYYRKRLTKYFRIFVDNIKTIFITNSLVFVEKLPFSCWIRLDQCFSSRGRYIYQVQLGEIQGGNLSFAQLILYSSCSKHHNNESIFSTFFIFKSNHSLFWQYHQIRTGLQQNCKFECTFFVTLGSYIVSKQNWSIMIHYLSTTENQLFCQQPMLAHVLPRILPITTFLGHHLSTTLQVYVNYLMPVLVHAYSHVEQSNSSVSGYRAQQNIKMLITGVVGRTSYFITALKASSHTQINSKMLHSSC